MKKLLSFIVFLLPLLAGIATAQVPFKITDSIDINRNHLPINVHGDINVDEYMLGEITSFPHSCIWYNNNVWMSGYDAGNSLHVSAQTYKELNVSVPRFRKVAINYWPGPLGPLASIDSATSRKWAKIWKVNGTDVTNFLALPAHTIANTPHAILTWPGKGNIYARGNGGAVLTIADEMAPFVDGNNNGIYEPLLGEYPDFKGDQVLWWIFNDNGPMHALPDMQPLKVEVHAMAYGYNRGSEIDKVVYFDYKIVNRSANDYHDFRLAEWSDADLGYYYDDYIGYDTSRRMGILYNGTNTSVGGSPVNTEEIPQPMIGITMVSVPGDVPGNNVPIGSFVYYNNDRSTIGNPGTAEECNFYMRGRMRNGAHFVNDFQGAGVQSTGVGAGPECNYVFTGDPGDRTQWSECTSNNNPGDRRFILASNDFDLNAGASQHVVMAFLYLDSAGGCPVTSFAGIKQLADTAWNAYHNPPLQLHRDAPVAGTIEVSTYPNPAHDKLYIAGADHATITVHSAMGQTMNIPVARNGDTYELDIRELPRGWYSAAYYNGAANVHVKFMKD